MSVRPSPAAFDLAADPDAPPLRDLLRFITCGSVDDGKSTLIGRLLFDADQILDDQLSALERDSLRSGTQAGALDLALALDGLAAEREQGITIDVAYRFFSTGRRSFIVADTPGHEQYTRNMATGASTAELAVLLVDARKGLLRQTKRHTLLVSMLGIRHVVVAVNKMDLVGWSREVFEAIMSEYRALAGGLGLGEIVGIPMAATLGDNVTRPSRKMPWYQGQDLLSHLETVEVAAPAAHDPFRLPVQWVNRPDPAFRGFAGLVSAGAARVGQRVVVLPSGQETTIGRIVTQESDLDVAVRGQSVTLVLADERDVSRGSVIADAGEPPLVADNIQARLFWMAERPLSPGEAFIVRIGAETATATVAALHSRVDLAAFGTEETVSLAMNDVGDVTLTFDRPATLELYSRSRELGGLILIDRESFDTVAMGLVQHATDRGPRRSVPRSVDLAASLPPALAAWLPAPFATPWRSALKTATWRAVGTLLTVGGAFAVFGNLRLALLLGAVDGVAKLALYFGHERLWARIGLGLRWTSVPAKS